MNRLKFSWPSDKSGTIAFHEMMGENAKNDAVPSSLIGVVSLKFSMKDFDNDCNDSVRVMINKVFISRYWANLKIQKSFSMFLKVSRR